MFLKVGGAGVTHVTTGDRQSVIGTVAFQCAGQLEQLEGGWAIENTGVS